VEQVYLMVAILSVIAEKNPQKAWNLNMDALFNLLDLAKDGHVKKLFWPSSIAVFGPDTPKVDTPQDTIIKPSTVYGISKLAGENWCAYYSKRYQVDVRSIRYPGLISYKATPGGGTTDYAVEIFHEAIRHRRYTSFLGKDTRLPMMYMDDAIAATVQVMEAELPGEYTSYNLSAFSFTPAELAAQIKQYLPEFEIFYKPDGRQAIADTWPQSIDDSAAQKDWHWQSKVNLEQMVRTMLQGLHFPI